MYKETKTKSAFIVTNMEGGEVDGYWKEIEEPIQQKEQNIIDNSVSKNISRVEIIGPKGREIVTRGSYTFDIQDEGRTLKIFRNENT